MKTGTHGPKVVLLQEALMGLGHPLPRWGADGWYGDETRDAIDVWASHHGLGRLPRVVPNEVIAHIIKDWEGLRLRGQQANEMHPCILDVRQLHGQKKALGKRR